MRKAFARGAGTVIDRAPASPGSQPVTTLTTGRRLARRTVLGGAAAVPLLAASATASTADAQPSAPARNPGVYRFRIGDIRAAIVSDGTLAGSPRIYAGNAPADELDRALVAAFLPTDSFVLNMNALYLEIGDRKVLVDPGAGATMGPNGGNIFASLAAIGVAPSDIDVIVVSHTHPDHVGTLRRDDGLRAFPKAVVHVPEPDWAFFVRNEPDLSRLPMDAGFRNRFIANIRRSLEAVAADAVLYTPGSELLPGVRTLPAGGHTPGMSAILVHSGREQLLVTSDAAYSPLLNLEHGWRPGPDLDPEAASEVRRRLFDRAAADGTLVLGFHFPFPGLGRFRAEGGRYVWVPAPWQFQI